MTTIDATPTERMPEAEPVTATPRAAFIALLARDVTVLRKEFAMFLARTVIQPLLLMFVFTYVFPKIGQGVGGGPGAARFSTLLVGGVIASTMIFQGIQAVALPLVQDFGFTREIEDRVLAPLPVSAIALEKVIAGAVQALVAGLLVFPMGLVIPATKIDLHINIPLLAAVMVLGAFTSAALGLFVGTRVEPRQVPLIFGLLVIPMTFLGAVYYPGSRCSRCGGCKCWCWPTRSCTSARACAPRSRPVFRTCRGGWCWPSWRVRRPCCCESGSPDSASASSRSGPAGIPAPGRADSAREASNRAGWRPAAVCPTADALR